MESIYSRLAALGLALFVSAPSHAATSDPEIIIYRVGGVNTGGVATIFSCTPFSGVPETFRIVIRDISGNITTNMPLSTQHLQTIFLNTGGGSLGTAAIAATSNQVVCNVSAGGGSLHTIRFNPITGTIE